MFEFLWGTQEKTTLYNLFIGSYPLWGLTAICIKTFFDERNPKRLFNKVMKEPGGE
jgi:hypothetical protein